MFTDVKEKDKPARIVLVNYYQAGRLRRTPAGAMRGRIPVGNLKQSHSTRLPLS